jgi:hypothetical protein
VFYLLGQIGTVSAQAGERGCAVSAVGNAANSGIPFLPLRWPSCLVAQRDARRLRIPARVLGQLSKLGLEQRFAARVAQNAPVLVALDLLEFPVHFVLVAHEHFKHAAQLIDRLYRVLARCRRLEFARAGSSAVDFVLRQVARFHE